MIQIFGDSHVQGILHNHNPGGIIFHGATAKGLNNPKSRKKYGDEIGRLLSDEIDTYVLMFGQVDVEFSYVYHWLANRDIDYRKYNARCVSQYVKYINRTFKTKTVYVCSVGLSAVADDEYKHVIADNGRWSDEQKNCIKNLHQDDLPNIYTRTKIVLDFNKRLKKKLTQANTKYIDVTTWSYDAEQKRISDQFYGKFPKEHHNYARNDTVTNIIMKAIENEIHLP
jgi:hypothetical protein